MTGALRYVMGGLAWGCIRAMEQGGRGGVAANDLSWFLTVARAHRKCCSPEVTLSREASVGTSPLRFTYLTVRPSIDNPTSPLKAVWSAYGGARAAATNAFTGAYCFANKKALPLDSCRDRN